MELPGNAAEQQGAHRAGALVYPPIRARYTPGDGGRPFSGARLARGDHFVEIARCRLDLRPSL